MPKSKFLKLDLNEQNVQRYTALLKKIKMPFTMEVSNYTTKIISDGYNIHFMKGEQSNRCFAAYSKIKSDLKDKEIPEIDMDRNCYYDTCFKGEAFYSDRVYNIDIKSAYATILFNDGYISQETFNYINSLPKKDRLACLGMLASRKDIFTHNSRGAVIKMEERISPLSNFFFHCVQKTEKIIQEAKNQILYESFLFSWVDGIYYLNHNPNYQTITQEFLKREYNLNSHFKMLHEFEVTMKNEFYKIKFKEQPDDKSNKIFNIPLPETELKRKIIAHLLKKQYDK